MTLDDMLASSPFTNDGLDRDLLSHLQTGQGLSGMQIGWPTRDRTERGFFWVAFWDRPTAQSRPDLAERELGRMQEQWDTAAAKFRHYLEGHSQRRQERHAAEDARHQAIAVQELDALTADLRTGYFSVAGATEAEFAAALPSLMEERRRQAALAGAATSPVKSPISITETF